MRSTYAVDPNSYDLVGTYRVMHVQPGTQIDRFVWDRYYALFISLGSLLFLPLPLLEELWTRGTAFPGQATTYVFAGPLYLTVVVATFFFINCVEQNFAEQAWRSTISVSGKTVFRIVSDRCVVDDGVVELPVRGGVIRLGKEDILRAKVEGRLVCIMLNIPSTGEVIECKIQPPNDVEPRLLSRRIEVLGDKNEATILPPLVSVTDIQEQFVNDKVEQISDSGFADYARPERHILEDSAYSSLTPILESEVLVRQGLRFLRPDNSFAMRKPRIWKRRHVGKLSYRVRMFQESKCTFECTTAKPEVRDGGIELKMGTQRAFISVKDIDSIFVKGRRVSLSIRLWTIELTLLSDDEAMFFRVLLDGVVPSDRLSLLPPIEEFTNWK